MTDETTNEQPRTLKVWVCTNKLHPKRQCFALVEDTRDMRMAHRQWHVDEETEKETLRTAIKNRDDTIGEYKREVAGYKRQVADYEETVAGLHGEVQRVETPAVPPALEINRDDYDEEQPEEPSASDPPTATSSSDEDAVDQQARDDAAAAVPVPGQPDAFSGIYTPAHNPYTGLSG